RVRHDARRGRLDPLRCLFFHDVPDQSLRLEVGDEANEPLIPRPRATGRVGIFYRAALRRFVEQVRRVDDLRGRTEDNARTAGRANVVVGRDLRRATPDDLGRLFQRRAKALEREAPTVDEERNAVGIELDGTDGLAPLLERNRWQRLAEQLAL